MTGRMTRRLFMAASTFGVTATAVGFSGAWRSALAETPPDTLVQAALIDDIISLDPAEIFEFSGAEYGSQVYDGLISYDTTDVSKILPELAESWTISEDGKTFTFKIREGVAFHSGNPLSAQDAVYSLQRVVALNLSPGFILTQFGFTPENMAETIKATDDRTLVLTTDQAYAPTFVLYCLTAGVGNIVDSVLVKEHEVDGDWGHEWLKTAEAGSGPFTLVAWKPNESVSYARHDGYWQGNAGFARVITRHVAEAATQLLLLEQGDVDIARNLTSEQLQALAGNADISTEESPKGALWYLGLNVAREPFKKVEVRQALKYLVDYQGMAASFMKGKAVVHQAFLPAGFLGADNDTPFSLDVAKAKELLAAGGYPDGFSITMDVWNASPSMDMALSIQSTFAEAGVIVEIIPGDNKATLTKYRARNHDIYIGRWGPDYQDPHTNASTFAYNVDNSDEAGSKPLAWRNSWDIPEMSAETMAAVMERDPAKRAELYMALQKESMDTSPFVILFQEIEVIASRNTVSGMIWGPSFDDNYYWKGTKS
jgi:peptide/nickel transport system substrate-binding protein